MCSGTLVDFQQNMANIHLQHHHSLGLEGAKARVNDIAAQIQSRLGVETEWSGNTLSFSGSGASGTIDVADKTVTIDASLGLMMSPFKGEVERQLKNYLDMNFS